MVSTRHAHNFVVCFNILPFSHPTGSQSPEITTRDALNALEMSRVALWNMYNNNTSPPTALQQTSPPDMQR
jgi:hypothetical protein